MRRIALFAIVLGFLVPFLASAPAQAQATRTWVSGVGDDVNPCSRTAPCKTFAGSISKTAVGGEINCLDPGGFGALTITKSITISCQIGTAGVLVSGTNGIVVAAGANDVVFLKGLDFEGIGSGLSGIKFQSGAALHVEDCIINGFTQYGIQIVPGATASFTVTRTSMFNNAAGAVQVRPTAGATTGVLNRIVADKNGAGISLDGNGGGGSNTVIRDSVISNNTGTGIALSTGGTAIGAMVTTTAVSSNGVGISASANAFVRVGHLEMTGNGTATSGTVSSFVTNEMIGNGGGETLTPLSPAQQ
jgi:hypothetical protein